MLTQIRQNLQRHQLVCRFGQLRGDRGRVRFGRAGGGQIRFHLGLGARRTNDQLGIAFQRIRQHIRLRQGQLDRFAGGEIHLLGQFIVGADQYLAPGDGRGAVAAQVIHQLLHRLHALFALEHLVDHGVLVHTVFLIQRLAHFQQRVTL